MMNTERPSVGLYQHFKGRYFFLMNILRDSVRDCKGYVCQYFDVLHPEAGYFARPMEQWFDDVSERKDNVTGQTTRFQRVQSIDTSMRNFSTAQLMKELSRREDSPLQSIDYEGLNERVVARDYIVGSPECDEAGVPGVFTHAAFGTLEEAQKFFAKHGMKRATFVYKRTFLIVE